VFFEKWEYDAQPNTTQQTRAMSLLVDAPTQVFSLFKLLEYPLAGDRHGDHIDEGFNRVAAEGRRTIVDCGLHFCESLVEAVRRGFVVHGFEPVPAHMENCHRQLNASEYIDVDVSTPDALRHARHRRHYALRRQKLLADAARSPPSAPRNVHGGFAFLYRAAVGNASATMPMRVGGGSSSLAARKPGAGGHLLSRMPLLEVPVVRIDDVVHEDVWLLKLDLQGFEWHALEGAAALFANHTVAHVFTEWTPRLLAAAGVPPRALVDTLKRYGMVCFDVRNGDGPRHAKSYDGVAAPWALGRDHPLDVEGYLRAMERNDDDGSRRNELGRARPAIWQQRYGPFDDLACINVGKAWKLPNTVEAAGDTLGTGEAEIEGDAARRF
jgi:FkbM family methyltransferase